MFGLLVHKVIKDSASEIPSTCHHKSNIWIFQYLWPKFRGKTKIFKVLSYKIKHLATIEKFCLQVVLFHWFFGKSLKHSPSSEGSTTRTPRCSLISRPLADLDPPQKIPTGATGNNFFWISFQHGCMQVFFPLYKIQTNSQMETWRAGIKDLLGPGKLEAGEIWKISENYTF